MILDLSGLSRATIEFCQDYEQSNNIGFVGTIIYFIIRVISLKFVCLSKKQVKEKESDNLHVVIWGYRYHKMEFFTSLQVKHKIWIILQAFRQ